MPVLELLLLRTRPGISPTTDPTLVQNLSTVRSRIHTNSRFYQCLEDPRLIYVLGQWASLAVHTHFLASPEREQILSQQTHQLNFVWMLHFDLPEGKTMEDVLPFMAPVLRIARVSFETSGAHVGNYERTMVADLRSVIVEDATCPYPCFDGWSIDAPKGKAEYVVLTGRDSVDLHSQFTRSMRETSRREYASAKSHLEGMEVRHSRNMEA